MIFWHEIIIPRFSTSYCHFSCLQHSDSIKVFFFMILKFEIYEFMTQSRAGIKRNKKSCKNKSQSIFFFFSWKWLNLIWCLEDRNINFMHISFSARWWTCNVLRVSVSDFMFFFIVEYVMIAHSNGSFMRRFMLFSFESWHESEWISIKCAFSHVNLWTFGMMPSPMANKTARIWHHLELFFNLNNFSINSAIVFGQNQFRFDFFSPSLVGTHKLKSIFNASRLMLILVEKIKN